MHQVEVVSDCEWQLCVIAGCVVLCEVLSSLLQTLQPHTQCVKFNVLLSVQFC